MKFAQYIHVAARRFLGLKDVDETTYTGNGGKVVTVKADESGLEFTTPSSGGASPPTTVTSTTTNADSGTNHTHQLDTVITAKSVTLASITVDAKGRVTAASSGSIPADWVGMTNSFNAGSTYAVLFSGDASLPSAQYFISYFFMISVLDIATGVIDYVTGAIVGEKTSGSLVWTVNKVGSFSHNVDILVVDVSGQKKLRLVPVTGANFGFISRYHFWRSRNLEHWA